MYQPSLFPFSTLSNSELDLEFSSSSITSSCFNYDLKKILIQSLSESVTDELEFKYYAPCQLNSLADKLLSFSHLSIFHVNVRSLNANHNKLITLLECLTFDFDVLILSEIWSANIQYYAGLFPDYNFFFELSTGRGGGVGIYTKKQLNATQTTKFNSFQNNTKPTNFESVWLEIPTKKGTTVIGGFYRHPNTSVSDFANYFLFSLDKLRFANHCYVFGDINISLSNYSSHSITKAFVESVLDANFLPYVYLPTRLTDHSATIIDHVYSCDKFDDNHSCKTGLLLNDIADHCANFMFIIDKVVKPKFASTIKRFRSFSKKNYEIFKNALSAIDWSPVYDCDDPNAAFNTFIDIFTTTHDLSFPFVEIKTKAIPSKKWITSALIKSINQKCKLYKKWIKSKKKCDENKYRNYSKILRKLLDYSEKLYYLNLFDSRVNGTKDIWRNINLLVNNKTIQRADIPAIRFDGKNIDSPLLMANAFNSYFCEVGQKLSVTAPAVTGSSLSYDSYLGHANKNSFFCSPATLSEFTSIVKDLKPSKNCIANCISSTLLKKCIDHVALPLLYICNLSFDIGTFPEQLKISKIVPVYKKGSKSLVSNYRPISITNPISKVFEKLIHARMVKYLDKYKLLYDYQYGFRKNHSTFGAAFGHSAYCFSTLEEMRGSARRLALRLFA